MERAGPRLEGARIAARQRTIRRRVKASRCLIETRTRIWQGELQMKHNVMLTTASLLSILFISFHLADDIVRGMEPGTLPNFMGVLILVVWLYATLVLAERRSGYVILLLGSLLGSAVPVF